MPAVAIVVSIDFALQVVQGEPARLLSGWLDGFYLAYRR